MDAYNTYSFHSVYLCNPQHSNNDNLDGYFYKFHHSDK
jgi:hypothetical protein